ncbi:MAG: cytochrome c [Chitinophagaceae bacterium]|nr:cytochrome c [Chitinophagaceae bacterium]MBN8667041.1 cytochrome c [Chitinophagales bacterium]
MKLEKTWILALLTGSVIWFISCGEQGVKESDPPVDIEKVAEKQPEVHGSEIKAGDIKFENPLNAEWVLSGKGIYELKCQACHKLTTDKLVGPGWKDVTKKREPVWIMNMITNVDMMLEKDPEAQKLLEQCLVRMPNQNITTDEARQVIEFMRQNDGEK